VLSLTSKDRFYIYKANPINIKFIINTL
jgi:hypothetical protein